MDFADITRKAKAARAFTVEVEPGVVFNMIVPTKHEATLSWSRAARNGSLGQERFIRWQRDLVASAVTGWTGVRLKHLLPDAETDETVDFDSDGIETTLDAQSEWEIELTKELLTRQEARKVATDTAEKNS